MPFFSSTHHFVEQQNYPKTIRQKQDRNEGLFEKSVPSWKILLPQDQKVKQWVGNGGRKTWFCLAWLNCSIYFYMIINFPSPQPSIQKSTSYPLIGAAFLRVCESTVCVLLRFTHRYSSLPWDGRWFTPGGSSQGSYSFSARSLPGEATAIHPSRTQKVDPHLSPQLLALWPWASSLPASATHLWYSTEAAFTRTMLWEACKFPIVLNWRYESSTSSLR